MGTDLDLARRLREPRPVLLDGAMGTELERRGARCELPLWSARALLQQPALVSEIHSAHLAAGAELVTANTFRTGRRTLARAGLGQRAAELTRLAVQLAREATEATEPGRPVWIAGSAAPLEDCYRPDLVPGTRELADEHAEHAENLAAAGVDVILVETMNSAREALAATRAARATGLPVLVSFTCGSGAVLLSGEPLVSAARQIALEKPTALLVNCLPPTRVGACLPILRASGVPCGAYPNLIGDPAPDWANERAAEDMSPAELAQLASTWMRDGIDVIGGCCGTTPDHVRALAQAIGSASA